MHSDVTSGCALRPIFLLGAGLVQNLSDYKGYNSFQDAIAI